jgi:broad specificity phosphatase PhoE
MADAPLYLVRHAKAGDRQRWRGDDRLRPLSRAGRRQARGLVREFEGRAVEQIFSSPYVRCIETVLPLAEERAVDVEESEALSEGASVDEVLELVGTLKARPAVLCSHGDVIPALVQHWVDRGMRIEGTAGWKKGSTWLLQRAGDGFATARYVPPPGEPDDAPS